MKICEECNIEMMKGKLHGEPFVMDLDHQIDDFSVEFIDGKKETKTLFGKVKEKDNTVEKELKCRVCPKCGKVELYIDIES